MVVLSASMPKSGSAYFYNIINELLIATGKVDARQIKKRRNLDQLMKWHDNNIKTLLFNKLFKLWLISILEGTFAVKTHHPPTLSLKVFNNLGSYKIIYCYRDPRDVLLSALDFGRKIIANGRGHDFPKINDFDESLEHVKLWLCVWKRYYNMSGVLMVRYEDMMERPIEITKQIENYLSISITDKQREEILWKYSRDNPNGDRTGMHFNKARVFRYKQEMLDVQKIKCQEAFGDYINEMGYDIE